jgi:hypothetical protein
MKRAILVGLFVLLVSGAYADSAYRNQCRQIIYAVNPVDEVAKVNINTLRTLGRYSLGLGAEGQDLLNETDAYLFSWLANTEMYRRNNTANAFSLHLQERKEANDPYLKKLDKNAITIDTWIDLFRINLILQ